MPQQPNEWFLRHIVITKTCSNYFVMHHKTGDLVLLPPIYDSTQELGPVLEGGGRVDTSGPGDLFLDTAGVPFRSHNS